MEQESVPDVVVETQVTTEEVSAIADATSRPKVEPVDSTNTAGSQPVPFIQRVVAVPPSVGSSVEVWPNQAPTTSQVPDVVMTDAVVANETVDPPSNSAQSDQAQDAKQYCCLLDSGKRCNRVAGNASFSRKINKMASQKGLKLNTDINCKHIYICDHHKNLIQRVRSAKVVRRQHQASDDENTNDSFTGKRSGSGNADASSPADAAANRQLIDSVVKAMSLQVLRRYRQAHKLSGKAGNKNQLQEMVASHFDTVPVNESDVVCRFFRVLRTNSNKLDQQLPNISPSTPTPSTPPGNTAATSSSKANSSTNLPSSSKNGNISAGAGNLNNSLQQITNVSGVDGSAVLPGSQSSSTAMSWS